MIQSRNLLTAILFFIVVTSYLDSSTEGAAVLPDSEVEGLKEVAKSLGKMDWNFSVNPCSGESGWATPDRGEESERVVNVVNCNCTYDNNTVCHVVGILLSSNNFTGPLLETLAKLINLNDFRISDNHFSGEIPNFIQKWTNLGRIVMQASGLQGPIPSGISLLTKITDMRISDLNGTNNPFPPLSAMKDMKTLVLRSCNIVGEIPPYLGDMSKLETLDLSFNKLTGMIPRTFDNLVAGDFKYLTGNVLTGPVPEWILNDGDSM